MEFRYAGDGQKFKGNPHMHTVASDGGLNTRDITDLYTECGYDFICITDHWVHSHARKPPSDQTCLIIPGMEIHGTDASGFDYHVVALGFSKDLMYGRDFSGALDALIDDGAFLILAHPHWTGNTFEDALRYPFDGIEIYNHVAHAKNGKSCGLSHWDHLIRRRRPVLGFACDDAHMRDQDPFYDGGWIVVTAPELNENSILEAIRRGRFYSSTGPDFTVIEGDENDVFVETSPVRFVRLVGQNGSSQTHFAREGDALLTETSFALDGPGTDGSPRECLRLEIEDAAGRRAWTNTLFTSSNNEC
jgi:hypothetical protein